MRYPKRRNIRIRIKGIKITKVDSLFHLCYDISVDEHCHADTDAFRLWQWIEWRHRHELYCIRPEWNQCPYGKDRENPRLPFEIIEIGAVKLDEEKKMCWGISPADSPDGL